MRLPTHIKVINKLIVILSLHYRKLEEAREQLKRLQGAIASYQDVSDSTECSNAVIYYINQMMSEDTGQDNTPANQAEVHLYYLLTYTVCVCVLDICVSVGLFVWDWSQNLLNVLCQEKELEMF